MKRILVAIALLLVAQNLPAQDWAKARLEKSSRHGEWVDFKSGTRTIKAFVVYPERKDKAPVVIVIHEIFGLTDWIRAVADQLAADGFIAVAPDLLSGKGPNGGGTDAYSDRDAVTKAVFADPAAYGLTNVKGGFLTAGGGVGDPDRFFWWDDFHLTRVVHRIVGEAAADGG